MQFNAGSHWEPCTNTKDTSHLLGRQGEGGGEAKGDDLAMMKSLWHQVMKDWHMIGIICHLRT